MRHYWLLQLGTSLNNLDSLRVRVIIQEYVHIYILLGTIDFHNLAPVWTILTVLRSELLYKNMYTFACHFLHQFGWNLVCYYNLLVCWHSCQIYFAWQIFKGENFKNKNIFMLACTGTLMNPFLSNFYYDWGRWLQRSLIIVVTIDRLHICSLCFKREQTNKKTPTKQKKVRRVFVSDSGIVLWLVI